MRDLGLEISGAKITFATGQHSSFPCMNIIRDSDTCWVSSGSCPQSFVVSLPQTTNIEEIAIEAYNVKYVTLESSTADKLKNFQEISKTELERTDGTKQLQQLFSGLKTKLAARHIKVTITRSFDHFVAVYHLKVIGSSSGSSPAKFSASQMGIGNGQSSQPAPNAAISNGGFGNSFSTEPIKMENKFDSFKTIQGPSSSNGFSQPNPWDSQGDSNKKWNNDDEPIQPTTVKWDNDEEPVVFGRNDNDIEASEDSDEEDVGLTNNGVDKFDQAEVEAFKSDELVQGFVDEEDEDSIRNSKGQW